MKPIQLDPSYEVVFARERGRYELLRSGELFGFMEVVGDGESATVPYLQILPEHRQQGLGTAFAIEAIRRMRSEGLDPVVQCGFVNSVLRRHQI